MTLGEEFLNFIIRCRNVSIIFIFHFHYLICFSFIYQKDHIRTPTKDVRCSGNRRRLLIWFLNASIFTVYAFAFGSTSFTCAIALAVLFLACRIFTTTIFCQWSQWKIIWNIFCTHLRVNHLIFIFIFAIKTLANWRVACLKITQAHAISFEAIILFACALNNFLFIWKS